MNDADECEYVAYVTARMAWMHKVAFLLCDDKDRADDLVQTALTRLYVYWHRVSGADNMDGYVRTMIVRAYLGERGTAWSRRVSLVDELSDTLPHRVMVGDPSTRGDPDVRIVMRAALAQVSPRQRAALMLRYYLDLSVEETAAVLRCSPGNVKSQTSRGLDALRRALVGRRGAMEGRRGRFDTQPV